jgi:Domain of unknown function (DUF397)
MTKSDPADRVWRRSSASDTTTCVEVAFAGPSVLVRHSRNPGGPTLSFTLPEWTAFLAGVRNGEFDAAGAHSTGPGEPATS